MKKTIISILVVIFILSVVCMIYAIVAKPNSSNNNTNTNTNTSSQNTTSTEPPKKVTIDTLTDEARSIFNSQFDIYRGEQIPGNTVRLLIASVKSSNETTGLVKVTIYIDGVKYNFDKEFDTSKTYSVSFSYDTNGLINRANIKTQM